jgi:hypothetical protein
MRRDLLALAIVFCMAAAAPEGARATSPEEDALLFLDSQVLPQKAAVCSARISGYSAKFEAAFRIWRATNKEHVAAGEAFLRADAERTQVPFERDVQAVIDVVTQQWTSASISVLQDNCDAMLRQLGAAPEGG